MAAKDKSQVLTSGTGVTERSAQLVQAAFDHFRCTYVYRPDLFAFSETLTGKPHSISLICRQLLSENHRPAPNYFRLPTRAGSESIVDDPDKYGDNDKQFEVKHGLEAKASIFANAAEPTNDQLERVLQKRVARVLERIELGLRSTKSFHRMRSSRGNRREIDILCEDRNGNAYVIEFKRFGVHTRQVVGQIVEYMGMQIARGATGIRGCIVVGDATEELLNARLIVKGLEVRTYRELLPEFSDRP
jgi:hypothetical protein